MVKVESYNVIHFEDIFLDEKGKKQQRAIILIYALGEDGIIYEMSAGKWLPLPIDEENMRSLTPLPNGPISKRTLTKEKP